MAAVRGFVFLILTLSLGCGAAGNTNTTVSPTASTTTNSSVSTTANPTVSTTANPTSSTTANTNPTNANADSGLEVLTVTSCSGVASCQFVFSRNGRVAAATTSTYVAGNVGDANLPFSDGSVRFQLQGESAPTELANSFSGTAVYAGYDANYGTLYQVSGNFSGTDAATNKVVNGSVSTLVGIKGNSGRDGGIHFYAVNGSMTIN